jgi:putative transposase
MTGILEQQQCPLVKINSVPDHIHILFALGRTRAISEVVQELKVASSHWFKRRGVSAFAWQAGYGVFSVSQAELPDIKRYIVNQTEHHRVVSFQEEYRQFMARHHLPFDERYGWD